MNDSNHCKYFIISISFLLALISTYTMLKISYVVPKFVQLLNNFGGSFPVITTFSIKYYNYGWALVAMLISLFCYLIIKYQATKVKILFSLILLFFIGIYIWEQIIVFGIYTPIFNLGSAI